MTAPEIARRYTGARVLVLGATGFLGRNLAAQLARCGADLHCVVRTTPPRGLGAGAIAHLLDLTDLDRATRLIEQLRPAIVFNLAGYGVGPDEKQNPDPGLAQRLNSDLPIAVARAVGTCSAGWTGRDLVHVGSIAEYGPIAGSVTERSEPRPIELYGVTKLSGTVGVARVAAETRARAITARLAQVYGPGESPGRLLPTLIRAGASGVLEPLSVGTQRKDFTFSNDVVEGLLRLGLTEGPPGEWVHLATGRSTRVRDFVLEAAHLLRLPAEILRFERPVPSGELSHESLSVDRLRALAGWIPTTTIREGIERTIAVHHPVPNE